MEREFLSRTPRQSSVLYFRRRHAGLPQTDLTSHPIWKPLTPRDSTDRLPSSYRLFSPASRMPPHPHRSTFFSPCSFCPDVPGLLATGSTDKRIKLWDVTGDKPSLLSTEDLKTGAVFALQFCASNPLLLAAGGAKGLLSVWDVRNSAAAVKRFGADLRRIGGTLGPHGEGEEEESD